MKVLRVCLHDFRVRYLVDPLLSQGMEIETVFQESCFVLDVGVHLAVVGKVPTSGDVSTEPLTEG